MYVQVVQQSCSFKLLYIIPFVNVFLHMCCHVLFVGLNSGIGCKDHFNNVTVCLATFTVDEEGIGVYFL